MTIDRGSVAIILKIALYCNIFLKAARKKRPHGNHRAGGHLQDEEGAASGGDLPFSGGDGHAVQDGQRVIFAQDKLSAV